jgi:hypothetical protein
MNNIELKFEAIDRDSYKVEYRSPDAILTANIPTFDLDCYNIYQQACRKLYDRSSRISLKSSGTINREDIASIYQELDRSATQLLDTFNNWGKSPELAGIATAIAKISETLQVTISTECPQLRKLPFHKWSLFPDNVEVVFSRIESVRLERTRHPDKIRILAILGDSTGIDVKADKQVIEHYCQSDAELTFLAQPNRSQVTTTLADPKGWDIIFFSGHSRTENNNTGRIYLNKTDSLTMVELKDVLKPAIEQRVQIRTAQYRSFNRDARTDSRSHRSRVFKKLSPGFYAGKSV